MQRAASRAPLPDSLNRIWRRLLRAVRPDRVAFFYSPRYEVGFSGTPIDPKRGERILRFLFSAGLLRRRSLTRPRRASLKALRRVHSDPYLESLRDMASLVPVVGYEPDDRAGENALLAQRYAVGGTIAATRRAIERRRTAVNLGGGFHHAGADGGRGFCIFNDVAVAIESCRQGGFDGRVLVIDLDLHDGNGTRRIFAQDERVFTFSIHNQSWDLEPARASLSIELAGDVEDREYLEAIRGHLPEILERERPDLIYYLAGTDPAHDDRIGNWKISAAGLLERDRLVIEEIRRTLGRRPLVIVLAGGYGGETWRYSGRFLAWLLSGRADIEPPGTSEMTVAHMRELVRFLVPDDGRSDHRDDLWSLSDEDIYGSLGEVTRRTRLLDYFSAHGIELILERAGLLDRLRSQGFTDPTLVLDLDNPTGQTLRVYGDADQRELLIELRAARERAAVPGFELLHIEWLTIQNPRASFGTSRPRLPGQAHPGLGLLREVMALLVLLAEQLQLDGILFVPSQYHLAAQGKKFLRFAAPENEAWFRAIERAVEPLHLGEASRAVRDGRVIDEASGEPIAWRPMQMVLPLSKKLREHLGGDRYETEVESLERGLRMRLKSD